MAAVAVSPASAAATPAPVVSVVGSELTWPAVPSADGYNVYFEDRYLTTTHSESYTATALGVYYITAFDKTPSSTSFSAKSNRVTVSGAEEPSTPFGAPVISANGTELTWPAITDADGYNVYLNTDYLTTVRSESFVVTNTGSYRVTAFDSDTSPTSYSTRSNGVPVSTFEGPGYNEIFRDDFEGTALSSNFSVPYWTSSDRDSRNSAQACSQEGGELLLSIIQVGDERLSCFLISDIDTFGPGPDSTMKVEIRANVSQILAKGSWLSGWMNPRGTTGGVAHSNDGDLGTGSEIDLFEYVAMSPDGFTSAVHDGPEIRYDQWTYPPDVDFLADVYHTYGLEWSTGCAVFSFDGSDVLTIAGDVTSAQQHSIMLTMEAQTGTQWGYWDVGSFEENLAADPALGKVDWVSVQEKKSVDPDLCAIG